MSDVNEPKIGQMYRWNASRNAWCAGGCGCNNYSTAECLNLSQERIVLGRKDRLVTLGGVTHRFSAASLAYCASPQAAQEAIAGGHARPVTEFDFTRPLFRAY